MKGVSAVIATILMLVITIAIAGTAYSFFTGSVSQSTATLSLTDSFQTSNGTNCNVTYVVRNGGSNPISASTLVISSVDENCQIDPSAGSGNMAGGSTLTLNGYDCGTGKYQTFRIRGPSNAIALSQYCP